jgi:ribose transport system substrate-binding protein
MYRVPLLSHALDIFELVQQSKVPYSLEEIHLKSGVAKSTAFRVLKTFVHRGYMGKTENGKYRFASRPQKLRFGYASMCQRFPFSAAVTASLEKAAKEAGVELIALDNDFDEKTAVANAEEFIAENVDLVIEFQAHQTVSAYIAHILAEASIPLITIDTPHPRSIFFGGDNYKLGYETGRLLAKHSLSQWQGNADIFLGLSHDRGDRNTDSVISATLRAVQKELGQSVSAMKVLIFDSQGMYELGDAITSVILKSHPVTSRVLIITTDDSSALGAVKAVRDLKRQSHVAIMSQNCKADAVREMQEPDSPLIGYISYEAETYGGRLVEIGLSVLRGEPIDPYNFVEHRVFTREMIQKLQPEKGSQSIESWIAATATENLERCRSKTNGGVVMQRRVRELQY